MSRSLSELLTDLDEAVAAAAEIVRQGKERWDTDGILHLAGEAVVGRIGDVATKLPTQLVQDTPQVPWEDVRGMRIIVDHLYHAVDYEILWETLRDDVPELGRAIEHWRSLHPEVAREIGREGPEMGL